jgi:hypothetical protein
MEYLIMNTLNYLTNNKELLINIIAVVYSIALIKCVLFTIILYSKYGKNSNITKSSQYYSLLTLSFIPIANVVLAILQSLTTPYNKFGTINMDIDFENWIDKYIKRK